MLETERLIIRNFVSDDAISCFESWGQDKELGKLGEIGYVIGEKYQHQGYAFEALYCIASEYFYKKGLYMLEAKYNERNIASANLLRKTGFKVDGSLRDRRVDFVSGKRCNLIVCSITKEEFKNNF